MWKTRFEVSGGLTRRYHRPPSSSSTAHSYRQVRPSPTVSRVREGSPSPIVVRPFPPSSAPQLDSLDEEDDNDISCSIQTNNEQSNHLPIALRRKHSLQLTRNHRVVLPTIVESNDGELMVENLSNTSEKSVVDTEESFNDRSNECITIIRAQQPLVASNTNYNQVINISMGKKERTLTTNGSRETTSLTLDKRITELIQQRNEQQNKSVSSSSDIDTNKISPPTTFKDISAFFEKKVLAASAASEPKKIIRAKRLLSLRGQVSENHSVEQCQNGEALNEEQSAVFHHQTKRIKQSHNSDILHTLPLHSNMNSDEDRSIEYDVHAETIEHIKKLESLSVMLMPNAPSSKVLPTRWFFLLIFLSAVLVYYCFSYTAILVDNVPLQSNILDHLQTLRLRFFPQQSKQQLHSIHHSKSIICRYGQFLQKHLFSLLDLIFKSIGKILFHIDKFECRDKLVYVATSTYESVLDWIMYFFEMLLSLFEYYQNNN